MSNYSNAFMASAHVGGSPLMGGRVVSVMPHTQNPNRPEYWQPGGLGFMQRQQSGGVAGGGGPGGANPNDAALMKSFQDASTQANAQEKARFDKMMGLAQQFGATQLAQNKQLHTNELAAGESSLMNRGLANSSATLANQTTANNSLQRRNTAVGEQQAQMELGVLGQVQVQRPDTGLMAQLFSQPRTGGGAMPIIPPATVPDLFGLYGGSGAKGSTKVKATKARK